MWRLRLRGAGQAARRKTGQVRRERAGRWELYYYHTLTCSSGLVAGGPGQAAAGQVARQGRAPVQWSRARPRLCGLQQISLALVTGTAHSYRSLRLLLRHRIGFTQVRLQGSSSLPCQKNGQQEMKFITK